MRIYKKEELSEQIIKRGENIKLLLTDCDGVLTDNGVYYGAEGERFKRFSIRDGMGVERLRNLIGVEVGIITGEDTPALKMRAAKLNITELHTGIKDKLPVLKSIAERLGVGLHEVAYIGDDTNDIEVLQASGLSACPADAMPFVLPFIHYQCTLPGGYGAWREFAELIITCRS